MHIQTNASLTIDAPVGEVFSVSTAIEPSTLIQKRGPLPAIVTTDGDNGPWSAIGQKRLHRLSDKTSVHEELVAFTRNSTFAYRVSEFSGLFGALTREARGEWHFTAAGAAKTKVDWTYFFVPTGPIAEPVLWFIVKAFWPGYLKSALARVKEKAEHENRNL